VVFLGLQELVSLFRIHSGGVGIPMIALTGLALIPFLDREEEPVGVWFSGAKVGGSPGPAWCSLCW